MIINTKVDPQPGQVFEPGCFDENVGRIINFMNVDGDVGQGIVTSVSVADDGSCAWLVVDAPGLGSDSPDIGPMILTAEEGPGYLGYAEEGI